MTGGPNVWWAVTMDCNDVRLQAEFWSQLLAVPIIEPGVDRPGWLRLQPRGHLGPLLNFQPVEGPRTDKARLHLDVLVEDIDAGMRQVVALGGVDTGGREELLRGRIAVMRDPEGNEFCLLAAPNS